MAKKNSTKGVFIRFYKKDDQEKIKEFKRILRMRNRDKPKAEQETFNDVFGKLIIDYTQDRIYENSTNVVAKMIIPLIKKGFKNQTDDLIELILSKFNEQQNQINEIYYYLSKLITFNSNILSSNNNLRTELENEDSLLFKKPQWIKK
ncbi:MAG: hypothetical protein K2K73_03110 [Ureaplasma sp.]|nr:hypothetical protein [Ureaplasma sp.]